MKALKDIILEKLIINKNIGNSEQKLNFKGVEINNDINCEALPKNYINAIINAFMKSPLKKNVIKIDVNSAKEFFDKDVNGLREFKFNKYNLSYLYHEEYPAITITYKFENNKLPKYDTIMRHMPCIYMPLILTDDKELFTQENTPNVTGYRDVEFHFVGFYADNKFNTQNPTYKLTIIYLLRSKATDKLLPIHTFEENLLKYYKMGESQKEQYLKEISKDFYTDVRRDKHGYLDLSKEREEECKNHAKEVW